jgi:hypothetical protein
MENTTNDTRTPEQHRAALHRIIDAVPDSLIASLLRLLEVTPVVAALQHADVEPEG